MIIYHVQVARVQKMLGDELGTASNIKSRVNRQSVLGAITSAQQRLKLYNKVGLPSGKIGLEYSPISSHIPTRDSDDAACNCAEHARSMQDLKHRSACFEKIPQN